MDIDLVYLWVNGNDPVWLAKKNAFLPPILKQDLSATGDCRYAENDELRYSLRSVERCAPWIRKIFIVTDAQVPAWLDLSNPQVEIVDHKAILPPDALPTFNANALEMNLWRIPGLSEHFLFANDDMFFLQPVGSEFFFNREGYPYVRLKRQSLKHHLSMGYPYMIYHMQQLIAERFGKHYTLAPHHNVDAYRLSDYKACYELFKSDFEATTRVRFRDREDIQRSIVLYYALTIGHGKLVRINRYNRIRGLWGRFRAACGWRCATDSRCIPLCNTSMDLVLKKYNPALICLNDDQRSSARNYRQMRLLLAGLFPNKSAFER